MNEMLDLEKWYPRMLAHCDEYLDSVGDNFLNMGATLLGVNAYALTGNNQYRDWTLEYMDAWKERAAKTGGMIPSNIGLDGSLGGEHDGQWWKGTYGWNFTIFDGELQQIAHRNYFTAASWTGFSNALLLTGDQSYVDVLRKQLDLIYDKKKVENGKTLLPQMYGDPRGYKYNGEPDFYHYTGNLFIDRLTEIYLWSMNRDDLGRIPTDEGWIGFLEGNNPEFPVEAMGDDFEHIRERVEFMRNDPTSADTRLADYLLRVTPPATETLVRLTTGGYFASGKLWVLHSRLRYFDPVERRAGLPADVAALVTKLTDDSVAVTLVNTNQIESREIIIRAGAYGEHELTSLAAGGKSTSVSGRDLKVLLAPGTGSTLELGTRRYANTPTLQPPWGGARLRVQ